MDKVKKGRVVYLISIHLTFLIQEFIMLQLIMQYKKKQQITICKSLYNKIFSSSLINQDSQELVPSIGRSNYKNT